ncbi:MAG: hypothetical protein K6E65_07100 [Olsenella sp.]|nr:hypothetical protein [Olsenella sp.]
MDPDESGEAEEAASSATALLLAEESSLAAEGSEAWAEKSLSRTPADTVSTGASASSATAGAGANRIPRVRAEAEIPARTRLVGFFNMSIDRRYFLLFI